MIQVSEARIPSNMSVTLNLCFLCKLRLQSQSSFVRRKHVTLRIQLLFSMIALFVRIVQCSSIRKLHPNRANGVVYSKVALFGTYHLSLINVLDFKSPSTHLSLPLSLSLSHTHTHTHTCMSDFNSPFLSLSCFTSTPHLAQCVIFKLPLPTPLYLSDFTSPFCVGGGWIVMYLSNFKATLFTCQFPPFSYTYYRFQICTLYLTDFHCCAYSHPMLPSFILSGSTLSVSTFPLYVCRIPSCQFQLFFPLCLSHSTLHV